MAELPEVPTDELLSFQDYPSVHSTSTTNSGYSGAHIDMNITKEEEQFRNYTTKPVEDSEIIDNNSTGPTTKSFWTLEYYQQFFDVDTQDVFQRILASMIPSRDNMLKSHIKVKPDLYGPFWISVTLIFTIAISGNVANYLQHANAQYHWKYDFHLVSYAATAICLYTTVVPFTLWGLLKWSSDITDLDGLEDGKTPSALELICIYGYSLFIYIPVSILWSIQVGWLQWLLVLIAALLSGSVLLFTLMPAFKLSKYNLLLMIGTISCHFLLAVGFKEYFFHVPNSTIVTTHIPDKLINNTGGNV